jgi:DNA-binding transcriptional regulator YiaG
MVKTDASDFEDRSDFRIMMEQRIRNNIERLPISDRVILSRIFQLPADNLAVNPYRSAILRFFDDLTGKYEIGENCEYIDVKLHSLKIGLEELWVFQARKGETFKLFQNFESFEKILFQSNPDYRGHYVHQFDVFLLGYYILNRILETDTEISKKFKPSAERNPNLTWMLASTFHDIGYPIEKIDEWFSSFLNTFLRVKTAYPIEIERILTPVFFDYLRYLSEEHYNQTKEPMAVSGQCYLRDWKFHNILLDNLKLKKDHGIISSLLLIHSLFTQEKIRNFNEWLFETFEPEIIPACHAISIHNLKIDYEKISLSQSPFAFLLVLCDTIQDWERSVAGKDHSELKYIEVGFSDITPTIEFALQINSVRKFDELDELQKRLSADKLVEIRIRQENGNRFWRI